MKSVAIVILALLITFFTGWMSVVGAPTLGTETWDVPGNSLNGWLYSVGTPPGGGASTVDVGGIGATGAAVRVTFGSQGFPANEDEKVFASTNSSGGIFAGNQSYAGLSYYVSFKFYADDFTTASNTLALFFYSETSGRTWKYALDGPASINHWYDYINLPMSWSANWSSPGFGQAQFNADIADVDQLGVWVYRSADTDQQTYGIDSFRLGVFQIPEPSTYAILAFTLLTLGLTLRRKQLISVAPIRELKHQ
jgi:hypothetical protein